MNIKKLIILTIVIILIGITGVVWRNSNTQNIQENNLKIGIILPLTGPIASLGESAKNSAELALTDTKNKNLELIFEDDSFDPKKTVSAFYKLINTDKVSAVVCFTSSPCNAVAPIAEENKITLMAIASDSKIPIGKKYVFRLEASPSKEAEKINSYIKEKNYKTISAVIAIHDGVQAVYSNLINDSFMKDKIKADEIVNSSISDYRTTISKIMASKPDAILVGLLPGDAGIFTTQARALGFSGDFIGFNFIEGQETLDTGKESIYGIVYSQVSDPETWFTTKYSQRYSKNPEPGSAHIYDSVIILSDALTEYSNADSVSKYLENITNHSGALGTFNSIEYHEFSLPVILKTIQDGKFIKLLSTM